MLNIPIIQNLLGQHFIITTANKAQKFPSLKAQSFHSVISCKQFIVQLKAPAGYWQQLALQLQNFPYSRWKAQNPRANIDDFIAQALNLGLLKVYKSASIKELTVSNTTTIKAVHGKRYQIRPASSAFLSPVAEQQNIQSLAEANKFIEQLALDEEALGALSASLISGDGSTTEQTKLQLAEAIVNGELIIDLQPEPTKPLSEGEFVEETAPTASPTPAASAAPVAAKPKDMSGQEASAAVLETAAEDGTPFCEVCENNQDEQAA